MITISDQARTKIQEFMKNENREGLALRFGIQGRHSGAFQYRLAFVEGKDRAETDTVVSAGAFDVPVREFSRHGSRFRTRGSRC